MSNSVKFQESEFNLRGVDFSVGVQVGIVFGEELKLNVSALQFDSEVIGGYTKPFAKVLLGALNLKRAFLVAFFVSRLISEK